MNATPSSRKNVRQQQVVNCRSLSYVYIGGNNSAVLELLASFFLFLSLELPATKVIAPTRVHPAAARRLTVKTEFDTAAWLKCCRLTSRRNAVACEIFMYTYSVCT